ncbi:MATE family efflux transporter [uncultured Desulfovibrio sp.]|uniref:MATE family efflux transporter n=1 Tax=uncultured Desulfovibrio sp. TaxID=167968 RepID=UPI002626039F|nr:MATE family efflux transporter [uncultured Desulfovibrio sp.]
MFLIGSATIFHRLSNTLMSISTATSEREPANALERISGLLSLLRFAFPTMLMMVFNGLYTIVDVIFVARCVNSDALSAINIINPAMGALWGLSTMLGTGGSALMARKMGEGDSAGARRNFTLLVLAGLLLGLLFSCLGLLFLDRIIHALGATEVLAPYCRAYFGALLFFTPAALLMALFAILFVTAGKPALNMALIMASGLTNIALDYVFMVSLDMGVSGAALATGIAFLIPSLGGLCFFLYSKGPLHFTRPGMRLREFGGVCFNGSSELIAQLSISVTTFLFNTTMLRLAGEAGVAALTIMAYAEYFLVTLFLGFSMGVSPVISYTYGSGNHARQRRILRSCLLFISVSSLLVFSAAMLGASRLIGIFAPPESRVFALADQGFHIFAFSFLFCGYGIFASSLFTALSNGKISAIVAFLRTFALIAVFLLILPEFFGLNGVWLAVPLAEALAALAAAVFVWRRRVNYHYL